jgi:tRNA threonylcarbamoyl adenosine modification protein YeaZ
MRSLLLVLDTSTEVTVVGLAWLEDGAVAPFASQIVDAPRAAMSRVLPTAMALLSEGGLQPRDIAQVIVGRGPGSFTGVRIGVATAKGLAHGLAVPLLGVGTLDGIAWAFADSDVFLGVVGDAMRGEVYPALFRCGGGRAVRLGHDCVAKPADIAAEWAVLPQPPTVLAGNGLRKYGAVFAAEFGDSARIADEPLWAPSAEGLFAAYGQALESGLLGDGEPGAVLPVYTRLSDAEEAEAARKGFAAGITPPASGVAGEGAV